MFFSLSLYIDLYTVAIFFLSFSCCLLCFVTRSFTTFALSFFYLSSLLHCLFCLSVCLSLLLSLSLSLSISPRWMQQHTTTGSNSCVPYKAVCCLFCSVCLSLTLSISLPLYQSQVDAAAHNNRIQQLCALQGSGAPANNDRIISINLAVKPAGSVVFC